MHQDKFSVYIERKKEKEQPSEYSYRKDWSRGNSYFLTHNGNDIEHYTNVDKMLEELEKFKEKEKKMENA